MIAAGPLSRQRVRSAVPALVGGNRHGASELNPARLGDGDVNGLAPKCCVMRSKVHCWMFLTQTLALLEVWP